MNTTTNNLNLTAANLEAMSLKEIAAVSGIPQVLKMSKDKAIARVLKAQSAAVAPAAEVEVESLDNPPVVEVKLSRADVVAAKRAAIAAPKVAKAVAVKAPKAPAMTAAKESTCDDPHGVAKAIVAAMLSEGNVDKKQAIAACVAAGVSYRVAAHVHYHAVRAVAPVAEKMAA